MAWKREEYLAQVLKSTEPFYVLNNKTKNLFVYKFVLHNGKSFLYCYNSTLEKFYYAGVIGVYTNKYIFKKEAGAGSPDHHNIVSLLYVLNRLQENRLPECVEISLVKDQVLEEG